MRDTAFVFFLVAVLCVSAGMIWGVQMSISEDHLLSPAHAHLNLVGWATLALFGVYYRLTPAANSSPIARIHAAVATVGVVLMVPGIALAIQSGPNPFVIGGTLFTVASMAIFLGTVLRHGFGPRVVP
jgi:peptidoglycan/LPS O-acetylase OafA/YrhL